MNMKTSPFIVAPNHRMATLIAQELGHYIALTKAWNFVGQDTKSLRGQRDIRAIVYLDEVKKMDWWPETRAALMFCNPYVEIYREKVRRD